MQQGGRHANASQLRRTLPSSRATSFLMQKQCVVLLLGPFIGSEDRCFHDREAATSHPFRKSPKPVGARGSQAAGRRIVFLTRLQVQRPTTSDTRPRHRQRAPGTHVRSLLAHRAAAYSTRSVRLIRDSNNSGNLSQIYDHVENGSARAANQLLLTVRMAPKVHAADCSSPC